MWDRQYVGARILQCHSGHRIDLIKNPLGMFMKGTEAEQSVSLGIVRCLNVKADIEIIVALSLTQY